jgi:selenocysteine lyase/cysteine desulfurase
MNKQLAEIFNKLEQGVYNALETYSNVHRGSGHFSMVSTLLFEQAREIVLEYLHLSKHQYTVIFCTPRRAAKISEKLKDKSYQILSSKEIGLSLGVRALAVEKYALPGGIPLETGGGNARLVSPGLVIWAGAPDKFEAGTPAVINIIAFARALQLMRHHGIESFREVPSDMISAAETLYRDELEGFSGRTMLTELKKTLIGSNIPVPTTEGIRPYINLDYAATTPTFRPVWNVVCQTWRQSHQMQQQIIQEVRSVCSDMLGAPQAAYEVIFTSNTTEAINLAAESLGRESEQDVESVVLNTLLEHNSNELPWRTIPNFTQIRLDVDGEGFLDLNELDSILSAYNKEGDHGKKRIRLIAMSGASNVLGTFNDLAAISRIVHQYGARLLVDAAQLVAHRKVEMDRWGIDYLTFSAHKVYAPFGTGVLIVRKGLLNFSTTEQEIIQASGEENAVGIGALGKALVLLQRIGFDVIREEEQALTARALHGLAQIKGLRLYGIKDPDSPRFAHKGGVIVFDLKHFFSNALAIALVERGGIGGRYGCHCAHLLIKRLLHVPPLLERFQSLILTLFPKLNLPGVARVSLGIGNNEEHIDTLIKVLGNIAGNHKTKKGIGSQMKDFARATIQRVYTQTTLNQSSNP